MGLADHIPYVTILWIRSGEWLAIKGIVGQTHQVGALFDALNEPVFMALLLPTSGGS